MTTYTTTAAAKAAYDAQHEGDAVMQPGTPGWWKVWGASVSDIRSGDLVATRDDDVEGGVRFDLVLDTFRAKSHPVRRGIVNAEGEQYTFGALMPIILFRQETHHTLAGSVR